MEHEDAPSKKLPMLKGMDNFQQWAYHLRQAAQGHSLKLWKLIVGDFKPETKHTITWSRAEIRARAAAHYQIANTKLRDEEIRQFVDKFVTAPNNQLTEWNKLNATAVHLICSTIAPGSALGMLEEKCAARMFDRLTDMYGRPNKDMFQLKFDALADCTYRQGTKPQNFAKKFWELVMNKHSYTGPYHASTQWDLYGQFIRAVRAHGDMLQWITSQQPNMESPTLLKETIQSFLDYECNRVQNAARTPGR